jgi:hypothetical protein
MLRGPLCWREIDKEAKCFLRTGVQVAMKERTHRFEDTLDLTSEQSPYAA